MKLVARKADGSRALIARRKPSTLSIEEVVRAFGGVAVPIGALSESEIALIRRSKIETDRLYDLKDIPDIDAPK